ncbi:GntR family transcriptional regulator [Actinokineospora soli]|uniref:GntR family transcriptional regulator n=1 Tax=Actinokineospora soli TaxID=1048753 RepID=A0ABW2TRR0_9PSEU
MVKFVTAPLHVRLADELRRRIARGVLPVGSALPSETQLCAEFGASAAPSGRPWPRCGTRG